MSTLSEIRAHKLIAIARGVSPECIPGMAEALWRGGVRCVEITFDHVSEGGIETTLNCIRRLSEDYGDRLLVGAGTVLTAEEVRMAVDAGAKYIISPNVNASVIAETKRLGAVSIPGALTPTECQYAVECGADFVKLFPADAFGPAYLKALSAPLKHISFLATGGVTPENLPEYLRAGAVGAGIGSSLINARHCAEGRFDLIEQAARAFTAAAEA